MMKTSYFATVLFSYLVGLLNGELFFVEDNYGESLGRGDDESIAVTLEEPFKFWDTDLRTLRISFNGGVFRYNYENVNLGGSFTKFHIYSVFALWDDADFRGSCNDGCGVFYRMGNDITNDHMDKINNLFTLNGIKFQGSSKRTLIVTWYKAPSFFNNGQFKNTFQLILTSDGVTSYVISSYDKIEYPTPSDTGYYINSYVYCSLPGDLSKLTCRSNINQAGVFLLKMTPTVGDFQHSCVDGLVEYTCSNCSGDVGKSTCISPEHSLPSTVAPITRTTLPSTVKITTERTLAPTEKLSTLEKTTPGLTTPMKSTLIQTTPLQTTPVPSRNCNINKGGCEDLCINSRCYCGTGTLLSDEVSCDNKTVIFYGTDSSLFHWLNKDKVDIIIGSSGFQNPRIVAVAHDYKNNRVFYSDRTSSLSIIGTMLSDGTGQREIYRDTMGVEDLAYDWAMNELYFTSAKSQQGLVKKLSNIEGQTANVATIAKLRSPRAIVMDPCNGTLFVSDWGTGEIYSIRKNETPSVVASRLFFPNALALDLEKHKLYWADAEIEIIEVANYDGSCRQVVSVIHGEYPFSMTFVNSGLIWTNWAAQDNRYPLMYTDIETGISAVYYEVVNRPFVIGSFVPQNNEYCEKRSTCDTMPQYPPVNSIACYPFGVSKGDSTVLPSDDDLFGEINLNKPLPFFSQPKDKLYININGLISLDSAISEPSITIPYSKSIIAGYQTDLITQADGKIFYRQTTDVPIRRQFRDDVLLEYPNVDFLPDTVIIVTYDKVPAYSLLNQRNTFQTIIGFNSTHSYAVWCFNRLDTPGGVVGFSDGDDSCNSRKFTENNKQLLEKGKLVLQLTNKYGCVTTPPPTTSIATTPQSTPQSSTDPSPTVKPAKPANFGLYGFGKDDLKIPNGDDNLLLTFDEGFLFFSHLIKTISINANGFLTPYQADSRRQNFAFPYRVPAIFLYAMSFNRSKGDVFARKVNSQSEFDRVDEDINYFLSNFNETKNFNGTKTFSVKNSIVVTYYQVEDESGNNNTFQLILACDNKTTYAIFKYHNLDSTNAVAGFSESSCNNFKLPESGTENSDDLVKRSNVGVPGIFIYKLTKSSCLTITEQFSFTRVKHKVQAIGSISSTWTSEKPLRYSALFTQMVTGGAISTSFISSTSLANNSKSLSIVTAYSLFSSFDKGKRHDVLQQFMLVNYDSPMSDVLQYGKVEIPPFEANFHCYHVNYSQVMLDVPSIKLAVEVKHMHQIFTYLTSVWLRNVTTAGFDVCYKELISFSGKRNITIHFLAIARSTNDFHEFSKIPFNSLHDGQKANGNEKFCQTFNFSYPYIEKPYVFVTPEEGGTTSDGVLTGWVHSIYRTHTVVCAKNSNGKSNIRSTNVKLHIIINGEKDPCSTKLCPSDQECLITAEKQAKCGCLSSCPYVNSSQQVCGNDFVSYKSVCHMQMEFCQMYGMEAMKNASVLYAGECKRQPYAKGIVKLDPVPGIPVAFCKYVKLNERLFHPNLHVKVLLTVVWSNATEDLHDAAASWSEEVSTGGFKVCTLVSGRHFLELIDQPSVYWVALQAGFTKVMPGALETGTVEMMTWHTGSKCQNIYPKAATNQTKIYVSVEHTVPRTFRDAMTAWTEVMADSTFRICARELQNFDGFHIGIKLHWLAVHKPVPLHITETGDIVFEGSNSSVVGSTQFCKTVNYNRALPSLDNPVVLLTPRNTTAPTRSTYSKLDLTAWVETANRTHLKVCYKSVRARDYAEEVRVQYTVLPSKCMPGEFYHDGKCFRMMSAKNTFEKARKLCQNSDVPVVDTVHKSHVLGAITEDDTWIGYNDSSVEGKWVAVGSGQELSYSNWASNQPDGGNNENCAIINSSGKWEDKACSSNQSIICEKDSVVTLCTGYCLNGGACYQYSGSEKCQCGQGYSGDRCEKDPGDVEPCTSYELHTEGWRNYNSNSSLVISDDISCDRNFTYYTNKWHRFSGAAGTRINENVCTESKNRCGTTSPGWLSGSHPHILSGVVKLKIHFYSSYCASDFGDILVKNCGNFFVYSFVDLPDWSCDYGVCTI